jgi:hypothetical protein
MRNSWHEKVPIIACTRVPSRCKWKKPHEE